MHSLRGCPVDLSGLTFFVISGFLISRIIFWKLEANSFSYADFYARRIKRIFPALAVVLTTCCYRLVLDAARGVQRLGQEVISGGAFFSNIALWRETGYFDVAAETKPLLHLWSLAVEEQFYVLWPLLLGLMWRRRLNFLTVTLAVAVASFALNIATVHAHPDAAFYSPLSRFWELMAGSVLAHLQVHHPKKMGRNENWRSLAGAGLVAAGMVFLGPTSTFPGWAALLPVLGAFLLLSTPGAG